MRTEALIVAALIAGPAAAADRVAAAQRSVRAAAGLGAREELKVRSSIPSVQGRLIVHFDHTFEGHRVFGSGATAQVLPDGTTRVLKQNLLTGVAAPRPPAIDESKAVELALARVAPRGPLPRPPTVERVLFPAQLTGGLPVRADGTLDRRLVVHAVPASPYVWAYEVNVFLQSDLDPLRELDLIVDASTGAILRATDQLQAFAPIPSAGTGHGYYAGTVPIVTSQLLDGTYALYDTTRGHLPNPSLALIEPDGSGWSPTGLQVWYQQHTNRGASLNYNFLFQQNPTNVWGDGAPFASFGSENGPNGETVGVDAMWSTATTWDFFQAVFGRDGFDGQGTTPVAWVLRTDSFERDNAYYSFGANALFLGAGTYPNNPSGLLPLTDLDIVAHEWTHGVTWANRLVGNPGIEEGAIVEGTCDFISQMVVAWAAQPGPVIPDTGAPWQLGARVNHGTPLRWFAQPARDGRSADRYYDGIKYLDPHASAGVVRRALYVLANGASSNPADESYSPFLPQGMTGIGNDATARIWFKTVTERLVGNQQGLLTLADARREAIAAALDLFPDDPAKVIAVENAFAAANLGDAHGAPPRTQVIFADFRNGDYIERKSFGGFYSNRQVFPKNETVTPRITVLNNANTAVKWSVGGPSLFNGATNLTTEGGVINPDGTWTTPNEMGWHSLTATSVADPKQFAEGRAFLINVDTDQDLEQDALDMGGIAFSWFLSNNLNPAHSVFTAPWTDDADVAYFVDAFRATWPAK